LALQRHADKFGFAAASGAAAPNGWNEHCKKRELWARGIARAGGARGRPGARARRVVACMERAEKLRRLSRMRAQLPFMSEVAMSGMLKLIKKEGPPEAGCRRQDIADARKLMLSVETPYGKLHTTTQIGDKEVEVAAPAAMLWHCSSLPAMAPLWERAMQFPRPWHIIFYGDEVGAGNALGHVQNRKSWAVYWTIAEFGAQALAHEDPRARALL